MFSLRKEKRETCVPTNLLGMYFEKYIAFLMVDWCYYILCIRYFLIRFEENSMYFCEILLDRCNTAFIVGEHKMH